MYKPTFRTDGSNGREWQRTRKRSRDKQTTDNSWPEHVITWCKIELCTSETSVSLEATGCFKIDFHEIRSPFSVFCHNLDTCEDKPSAAGDKIWTAEERIFPQKMSIFQPNITLTQTINSIYTSCIQEPEMTPYISHTSSLKHISAIPG